MSDSSLKYTLKTCVLNKPVQDLELVPTSTYSHDTAIRLLKGANKDFRESRSLFRTFIEKEKSWLDK